METRDPYIVGILASRVRTAQQIDELALCIGSITAQTVKPHQMLVSWSADTAEIAQKVKHLLCQASGKYLVELQQHEAYSQFDHFDACRVYIEQIIVSREGRPADSVWCLFSDDDDLWHPERCQRYLQFLHHGIRNHPAKVAELCGLRCIPYATDANTHSAWTQPSETASALRQCPRRAFT